MCTTAMPAVPGSQKVLDPLKLESWVVVNHCVGARSQTECLKWEFLFPLETQLCHVPLAPPPAVSGKDVLLRQTLDRMPDIWEGSNENPAD